MGEKSDKYRENAHPWLLRIDHTLHKILPGVLGVLLAYLAVNFFTSYSHPVLDYVEIGIISYFAVELLVMFLLYDSKRGFFKDKWLYILLILPVFATFRAAARLGYAARGVVAVESLAVFSLPEARGAQHTAQAVSTSRYSRYIPYIQKAMHAVLDIPKIVKYKLKGNYLGKGILTLGVWAKLQRVRSTNTSDGSTDNEAKKTPPPESPVEAEDPE